MQTIADQIIAAMRQKNCWYVSCGGSAGTTFQIALGERVPRREVIRNEAHSDLFRRFEGEANLLVWCSWRLDSPEQPLSSSDDTLEHVVPALESLVGRKVLDVKIELPSWDIVLILSGGLVLRVFCDHLPGDPSFDGNWELFLTDSVISIGVGSRCEVKNR